MKTSQSQYEENQIQGLEEPNNRIGKQMPVFRSWQGARMLSKARDYGVFIVFGAAIVTFAVASPDVFPTTANAKSILTSQSILVVAALGVTIPLVSGQFDLSIAGNVSFSGLVVAGLMSRNDWSWPAAIIATLALAASIGLVNGVLVAYGGVHSFIATLGTGTLLTGASLWYSGGQTIFEGIPAAFPQIMRGSHLGIPNPVVVVILAVLAVWILLSHTPLGRNWYAIGGNRPAAEVAGVAVRNHIVLGLVIGGLLGGVAAVMLVSRAASALPGGGDTYLLSAFAAAFIGSAAFRSGAFNAVGTLVGVYFLATLVNGAFTLGASNYVTSLISGAALLLAVLGNQFTKNRRG